MPVFGDPPGDSSIAPRVAAIEADVAALDTELDANAMEAAEAVAEEAETRADQDEDLGEELDAEQAARNAGDIELATQVGDEIQARIAGDAAAIEAGETAADNAELTHADRIATAADRVQTGLDRVATAADHVATAADRVATGGDRTAVAADRVQTGLDRAGTAADRVQTGLDRAAAEFSRLNLLSSSLSRAAPFPFEDFDRADGVFGLNGLVSRSGYVIAAANPGGGGATIRKKRWTATGNTYTGFTDTVAQTALTPINEVWGVFSWEDVASRAGYQEPVIMFNGGTGPTDISSSGKLIHCEFPFDSVVLKVSDGSAGLNLVIPAGTVTERNGRHTGGGWDVTPRPDLTPYAVGMEFTMGATAALDVVTVYCADGRILDFTGETKFRTVMATCYHATFQLVNLTANYAPCGWEAWGIGPKGPHKSRALGGGAHIREAQRNMRGGDWRRYPARHYRPTAAGWYTIATHTSQSLTNLLNFEGKLIGQDNQGRRSFIWFRVGVETNNSTGATVTAPVVTFETKGGGFGGGYITQWRITSDDAGNIHFDIYVASYVGTSDYVAFECEGAVTPVAPLAFVAGAAALVTTPPLVGVTKLGTFSAGLPRMQVGGGRAPDVEFTTASGDSGWIAIATHIAANGSKSLGGGRIILSATDAAGREDLFEVTLERAQTDNSRRPQIREIWSTGFFGSPSKVVDKVRYSLTDVDDTGQFAINVTARASVATIKGWWEGAFTASTSFAVGAAALATIERTLTLGLPQSTGLSTATGAVTLTPGIDYPRQKHVANVGGGSTWTLDDTKASRHDWFRIHRPTTGNTGTVTIKDGAAVTIGTLAPGEWGYFDIDSATNAFVMTQKGSGL